MDEAPKQPRVKTAHLFDRFANATSRMAGRPLAFVLAVIVLVVWAACGPVFGFSDTWQLVVNTITTLITFLMVFVIQSSQNRDSEAIQIKLDEIVRAMEGAHLAVLDLEELDEHDLDLIRADYRSLAAQARLDLRAGRADTHTPEIASHIESTADDIRDTANQIESTAKDIRDTARTTKQRRPQRQRPKQRSNQD